MTAIDALPPLPVAVPLLGAALLVALHAVARRRFADTVATTVAAAVTVICVALLVDSAAEPIVYWFGNWTPREGIVLGVAFVIDPIGAGMAAVCSLLVTAAFVFSWRYFEAVGVLFHSLVLVFLAAMCGFCLSGDLFNLFVFFELMSVAAYALTGYKTEEAGPLQGALNFAVTNSVGAFMVLTGIALVYARTGALNLAAIGRALEGEAADGLVIVAFVLIVLGFLVKGAVVPFHFWLADAHAVAPTPVCVLFSGVMVELGLYAAARVYWTVFHPVLGAENDRVRALLVGVGVITALVGGVMALAQSHLKRLLAFSTVSHAGMFLIGVAMFESVALAGTALYVMAHAALKGALFMCAGVLLHRWGQAQIGSLAGKGRSLPLTGAVFGVAALGLCGLPPFGTAVGKGMVEEAAAGLRYGWVAVVFVVASALTGAAVLRAGALIFLGWDRPPVRRRRADAATVRLEVEVDHAETVEGRTRTPAVMVAPALVLVVAAFGLGLAPGVPIRAEAAAARFVDVSTYAALVIEGAPAASPPAEEVPAAVPGALVGLLSTALAAAIAAAALGRLRLLGPLLERGRIAVSPIVGTLRTVHSGHIGDYIAWLTVGVAVLGGTLAVMLR